MATPTRSAPRAPAPPPPRRRPDRRRRLASRLAPLALAAVVAFGIGIAVGAGGTDPRQEVAQQFADAWSRGDYKAMHALLTPAAQQRFPLQDFAAAYREAATTSTLDGVRAGKAPEPVDGTVTVPVTLRTRIFGDLRGGLALPVAEQDDGAAIEWQRTLVQPGLRRGEKLTRDTELPPRAAILARDGTPLAEGEDRLSELGPVAAEIAGRVGPAPPERAAELERRGVPDGAPVGLTGLERQFDADLAGTPGGRLLAGDRELASVQPERGHAVRTTIDPDIQATAVSALAGRLGGVAVIRPSDGEVLALAGIAYSAPQPPGSVFKIITLTSALESGAAKPGDDYPVETAATLEGVQLENANGESCGGSLEVAFAHSCNSVFAPMGVDVGAQKLVKTAEDFGFNKQPALAGAARSTIPAAAEIGDDLALGSTAIGQGKVLATPLLFAGVAGAIAERGMGVAPTLRKGAPPERKRMAPERVARTVAKYMRSVVTSGTGVAANIPGVRVAGKTGTAELRDTTNQDPDPTAAPVDPAADTNAWFTAFAPMRKPEVAVAVMLVGAGAGGDTAAPVARAVLEEAL